MPATQTFDPLFPETLTADITHLHVLDNDGTPNRVLEIGIPWGVEVDWRLFGHDAGAIGGTWDIHVSLESIGPGSEGIAVQAFKPLADVEAGSNAHNCLFRHVFDHIDWPTIEGVYRLVTLITYRDLAGHPSDMAGFREGPLITFYHSDT